MDSVVLFFPFRIRPDFSRKLFSHHPGYCSVSRPV